MSGEPKLFDAVAELLAPLLGTLERVGWVQRQLYPPLAPRLADELAPCRESLAGPLQTVEALDSGQRRRSTQDRTAGAFPVRPALPG